MLSGERILALGRWEEAFLEFFWNLLRSWFVGRLQMIQMGMASNEERFLLNVWRRDEMIRLGDVTVCVRSDVIRTGLLEWNGVDEPVSGDAA